MNKAVIRLLASCVLLICVLSNQTLNAQAFKEEFGKNRVQYKSFDWNYYSSEHFEVYYYGQGESLAKMTIEYLESKYSRITETIGYFPLSKTRVFLYNSVTDKQQSNVGLRGRDFTVGGETNFIKSQVEIAGTGDLATFKQKLIFSMTDTFIQEMLYGGNIAEMFQSSITSPLPIWFTGGVSRFIANGWTKESDDAVRDFIANNKQNRFNKLTPQMSVLIGESIWNYINQRHGQRRISSILNLTRIIRNEENSIERTIGIPFNTFLENWRMFYSNANATIYQDTEIPNPDYIISGANRNEAIFTDLSFSPNGGYLAFAQSNDGKFQVDVVNMATQRKSTIYQDGLRLIDQEVDRSLPLLSWADSTTLGIIYAEEGSNILAVKRIGVKGEQKLVIPLLSNIQSFEFKDGGRQAVMTGDINGVSDAFLYNLVRGQVRRITNDRFDDRDITYIPGTNEVIFSSNRPTDSVFVSGPDNFEKVEDYQFNVYSYDLDYPDSSFNKVTNALARNVSPFSPNGTDVYYLSDQQGIHNLFRFSLSDSITSQVSNFSLGIKNYAFDKDNQRLAYISIADGKEAIFFQSFDGVTSKFSAVTPRRALEISWIVAELRKSRIASDPSLIDSIQNRIAFEPIKPAEQKLDSLKKGAIDTDNYQFNKESKVDTKDYQFEKPKENPATSGRGFLSIYQNASEEEGIQGPEAYENRFQTDNVVTTFLIDELRSFSQLFEVQMNDYLENHRLSGGLLVPMSFNQGYDVYAEYEYLKHRIDAKVRYSRQSIITINRASFLDQRYNLDRFELGFSYPVNQLLRIEANPFFTQTRFVDRDFLLLRPNAGINVGRINEEANQRASYLGLTSTVVFDNSVVVGTNLHEGTRAKLTFETHGGLGSGGSFNNLELDVRHYQKINKAVYLAARFYYGSYFGDAPKRYYLGGIDNWAFNSTDVGDPLTDDLAFQPLITSITSNTGVNPNKSDILFNQFVNLRGYNYNTFQGRNVMTFSGEVRFPVNELLKNSELKSNFLRNLQIIGFYDIGSSWDDLSPFQDENNQNTEEIRADGSPFSAVINNFSNPWLQTTGVGMRTMFLGFFSRLDFSFPIRNFEVLSPTLQLSFGYDF